MQRRSSVRPQDEPIYTSPTGMDFEKRRLVVTSVSGQTVASLMPSIASAIVCFEDNVVSNDDSVVYQL